VHFYNMPAWMSPPCMNNIVDNIKHLNIRAWADWQMLLHYNNLHDYHWEITGEIHYKTSCGKWAMTCALQLCSEAKQGLTSKMCISANGSKCTITIFRSINVPKCTDILLRPCV
jgi:hypothetical protein